MSTVIGLVKEEQQLVNLSTKLEAMDAGLEAIKVLRRPDDAEDVLYKNAYTECHLFDCMILGGLAGLAVFVPLGLIITLFSCEAIGGCSPLAWGPGMVGLATVGAIIGAVMGSFYGTNRLEKVEQRYFDALRTGEKLVVIPTDTKETAQRTVTMMQQEHATAVKILNDD